MQPMHDVHAQLVESCGELAIRRVQEIPDYFLDHLADERFDSIHTKAGEMHRLGSVPVALVESWQRQGFDVYRQPVTEIIKRLKIEGYDKFLSSTKRI